MEHRRLSYLLNKYHRGECNHDELQELEGWYDALAVNDVSFDTWLQQAGGEEAVTDALFSDFKNRLGSQPVSTRIGPFQWGLRIAAGFIGAVFALSAVYWLYRGGGRGKSYEMSVSAPPQANESRYLILPDSSRVVLHAGSQIGYTAGSGKTRQVSLSGEAYFEVKPDKVRPFIIHTGKVITTVLGTAFNIRAYPGQDQITVTVSRGKVKVEDDTGVLGILTGDQEIVYSSRSQKAEKVVKQDHNMEWVREGMEFESVSFKKIASYLDRRYGVTIRFDNPALEGCPITATFNGTETLSEVLDIITITRQAAYRMQNNGKDIMISGEGCLM